MSPRITKSIERKRLLLVEGNDDEQFFASLLTAIQSTVDVQIIAFDGISNLPSRLELISKLENFSSVQKLAIVRDADTSSSDAFKSISNLVQSIGFSGPLTSNTYGTGSPSVGIFIMPGGGRNGALESLCLSALKGFSVFDCVDKYIDCVQNATPSPLDPNLDKVRLGTYIATIPGIRLIGEAARNGNLNFNHSTYDEVKGFLKELVE